MNSETYNPQRRWANRIRPVVFDGATKQTTPTTVFLGGQPAAGKTRGQELAKRLHPGIIPIIGDDYRQYHPDYQRLMRDSPLDMPTTTSQLAGTWTGMCVDYADEQGYSILIEGTWRNSDTVLREAERCYELQRSTHAIIVATPPLLSRAGMLDRYCSTLLTAGEARWTPPNVHDETVRALDDNVFFIASSGLMDRLTVTDRNGEMLYTGSNPNKFTTIWRRRFHAPLTKDELSLVKNTLMLAERCKPLMSDDDYRKLQSEASVIAEELKRSKKSIVNAGSTAPFGRWKQNRNADGSYAAGGHWE